MRCTFLTLAILVACKDKPPPPPPPQPPHDGVTLIQPGTAPHRALRYQPAKGARTTSQLVLDIDITSDGQGGPLPTLVVDLETTVEDVRPDGTARLRVAIVRTEVRDGTSGTATDATTDATTDGAPDAGPGAKVLSTPGGTDAIANAMRTEAAAMQGIVITETLAPDGKLSDAHIETAAALSDKVRAQLDTLSRNLEQVSMRMPTEPVGLGAIWRERRTLPPGGIRAVSETTYTLISLTGDVIGYTSTGVADGGPQVIEQEGMTAEITRATGTSEARGSVDLSRYALAVTLKSTFTTAMNVTAPQATAGAGPSTIEVATAIQLSSAVPPDGASAPAPDPTTAGTSPSDAAAPTPSTAPGGGGSPHGAHRAP